MKLVHANLQFDNGKSKLIYLSQEQYDELVIGQPINYTDERIQPMQVFLGNLVGYEEVVGDE